MIKNNAFGIIFANMHDDNLHELTARRTTGSVPFGGRYRFIDFTLSNMVNAGLTTVGVITKQNYMSLMDHLSSGRNWDLARKRGGLVFLPPMSLSDTGVYSGRLEALCNILSFISSRHEEYVIISDSNVICNMDLSPILDYHIENEADITMVYKKGTIDNEDGYESSVFEMDGNLITGISYYSKHPEETNVNLDVTIIKKDLLIEICTYAKSKKLSSFKNDYLVHNLHKLNIYGYLHKGLSLIINSKKDYYKANMLLLRENVRKDLFLKGRPVYTKVKDDFPATYGLSSTCKNSLIADGCQIEGEVENSILFRGVKVNKGAVVKNSIIMQGSEIKENCSLNYVVADKNVSFSKESIINGTEKYPVYFSKGCNV